MEEHKKRILIVDDLDMNREILRISFDAECDILEAENGKEALHILETQPIDLLITDVYMQEMNGYELIQYVRERKQYDSIPIIAITEHDEVIQKKVLELGADEFIYKPFVDKALRSCISGILYSDRIKMKIEQFELVYSKNPVPFLLYKLLTDAYGTYQGVRLPMPMRRP